MNNSELSKLIKICNIDPKQTKDEISQNIKLYFDTHNDISIILDVLICKTLKIILPRLRIVNKSSLKKDAMISVIKTHFDENFETKLINGTIIYNTDNAFGLLKSSAITLKNSSRYSFTTFVILLL